jgi:hypothetical protein
MTELFVSQEGAEWFSKFPAKCSTLGSERCSKFPSLAGTEHRKTYRRAIELAKLTAGGVKMGSNSKTVGHGYFLARIIYQLADRLWLKILGSV